MAAVAGTVVAIAGLVLGGVVYAHHYRPRLLNDIAVGLLCAGVLMIALSIEGASERMARKRRKQTDL